MLLCYRRPAVEATETTKMADAKVGVVEESAEIKSMVLQYYDALLRSDLASLERFVSGEKCLLAIGTQPYEWYRGRAALLQKYKQELQSTGGLGFAFTAGDVEAYSEGSVGWAADRPTIRTSDGSDVPLRFTFLFHREDGRWTLVQGHMSVGIPDEELTGHEPPIWRMK
jgi:ketosteroid isomerase-like protein